MDTRQFFIGFWPPTSLWLTFVPPVALTEQPISEASYNMLLTQILLAGTFAARPTASTLPNGTLYAATDTGVIYQVQSAAWATWYPAPSGAGTVTNVATGTGLTGGPITSTGTIALANTAVTPGPYGSSTAAPQITVDAQGRLTAASQNSMPGAQKEGTVTSVATGTGLSGGPITATGTISLADTAVTAGTYGDASNVGVFTVDQQGRITAASEAPISGGGGGNSPTHLYEFDDFVTNTATATQYKFAYTVGTNPALQAPEANHPGIVRLSSTGTNTMGPYSTVARSILPTDSFKYTSVVRPNSHANSHYYTGLWNNVAVPPTNGIWVEGLTTDTNWHLVCRSGGVQTRVDTGVAITSTAWYQIEIRRVDASTIGAVVNGATEVTCTTNIPTATLSPWLGLTATSGTQSIDWDFWALEDDVARY